jgi:transcriptional regulator with XRE-family HTH domain
MENILELRQQIGEKLKQARKRKNLTQLQLRERINIAQMSISKIEKGQWAFSIDVLLKFCEALEIELILLDQTTKDQY